MANTTHFAAHRGSLFAPLAGWFHSLREQFARRRNYRRTLNELSTLNAHQLADLGLHRSSLRQTAHQAAYHQIH